MSLPGNQPGQAPYAQPASLGDQLRSIGGIAAAALLVLFFLQNLQEVSVHFLWFEWTMKMIFALIITAAVGAVAAVGVMTLRARARARRAMTAMTPPRV